MSCWPTIYLVCLCSAGEEAKQQLDGFSRLVTGLKAKFTPAVRPSTTPLSKLLADTEAKLKEIAPAVIQPHGVPNLFPSKMSSAATSLLLMHSPPLRTPAARCLDTWDKDLFLDLQGSMLGHVLHCCGKGTWRHASDWAYRPSQMHRAMKCCVLHHMFSPSCGCSRGF
jgi:hypothetical protein